MCVVIIYIIYMINFLKYYFVVFVTHYIQIDGAIPSQGGPTAQPRATSTISKFKKLSLSWFEGTTDLLKAKKWLIEMEKIVSVLKCPDGDKVSHTTYILQGDAYDWWLMDKHQHEGDVESFTWAMF